jgi:drug/metabolite transporter (DMT)-like permease
MMATARRWRHAMVAGWMLTISVLCWAISFPIAKQALNEWKDFKFFFLAGRFWLAFLLFAPFALYRYGLATMIRHIKPGLLIGASLVLTYAFQYEALRSPGTSGEVAFISAFSSVLVPVIMWTVYRSGIRLATLAGLVIATVGVTLMTVRDGLLGLSPAAVLSVVGAIGIALNTILVGSFRRKSSTGAPQYETVPLLVTQFMTVALGTSLAAFIFEQPLYGFPTWSRSGMFGMIFMAVIATGLAFYLQTKFQRDISPDRASLIFTIEPAAAALFSYALLGEVFTARMAVGAVLILIGVGAAEFYAARAELPRAG